jgi:hypothetical protein
VPTGAARLELTKSGTGTPVRIENATLPFLSKIKAPTLPSGDGPIMTGTAPAKTAVAPGPTS